MYRFIPLQRHYLCDTSPKKQMWRLTKAKTEMKREIIHLSYVVKCFLSNVIILIATKNCMNFVFYFFFLEIFANFHFFLNIMPLSGL